MRNPPELQDVRHIQVPDDADDYLNIHGQYSHHSSASIVGTGGALRALAAALGQAEEGCPLNLSPLFASDGEGYDVEIRCVNPEAMLKESPTYMSMEMSAEAARWQARAFEAEAALFRLRRQCGIWPETATR